MTNVGLEANFWAILRVENVFDRYEMLMEFDKDYRQSDFYKLTKMKVLDAFNYYMQQTGNMINIINLLGKEDLNKLTENFGLDKLMERLKPEDRDFIKGLVDLKELKNAMEE